MKGLPGRVVLSYIFDYFIVIAFAVGFAALDKVAPFNQHFSLRNYTLQYPYKLVDTVTVTEVFIYVLVLPAAVILIWTLVIDGLFSHQVNRRRNYGPGVGAKGWRGHTLSERLWELNCGILGLLLAVTGALVVTQVLKNVTGKPRPDLIARCMPKVTEDPILGLSNSSICTQESRAVMWDGFRSWPSGHTTTSFAGLGFIAFFMAGKLHVLDSRGEVWKAILVLIPVVGASLIAVTRIKDARHHPFDVISGAIIGWLFAWGAYRQYFPALHETWKKGRAHPVRSWGRDPLATKMEQEDDKARGRMDSEVAGQIQRGPPNERLGDEEGKITPNYTPQGIADGPGYVPARRVGDSFEDVGTSTAWRGTNERGVESYEMSRSGAYTTS